MPTSAPLEFLSCRHCLSWEPLSDAKINCVKSTGLFRAMVIGMMAFTVLDMLCGLQENGAIRPTRWCVEVLNVLYFSVSAATVFVACLYTENELGATWLGNRKKIGLLALPLMALVVCLPLTLQYGFFFYISSDGRYIKGPAYVLMALMSYGYLLVIGVKALRGCSERAILRAAAPIPPWPPLWFAP